MKPSGFSIQPPPVPQLPTTPIYLPEIATDLERAEAAKLGNCLTEGDWVVVVIGTGVMAVFFWPIVHAIIPSNAPAVVAGMIWFFGPLALAITIASSFVSWFKKTRSEEQLRKLVQARLEREAEENRVKVLNEHREQSLDVERTNISLLRMLGHSEFCYGAMNDSATELATLVNRSEALHSERAFSPFWDAIDTGLARLEFFRKHLDQLLSDAREYKRLLTGKKHNFPPFPLDRSRIPKLRAVVDRLNAVTALALRDYQFSSIYEQRRTTKAVDSGFRNLEHAIRNLGSSIESSLASVEAAIRDNEASIGHVADSVFEWTKESRRSSETIAEVIRESDGKRREIRVADGERDAKHQEFVETALDNIQNKRAPRPTETKDPLRE